MLKNTRRVGKVESLTLTKTMLGILNLDPNHPNIIAVDFLKGKLILRKPTKDELKNYLDNKNK